MWEVVGLLHYVVEFGWEVLGSDWVGGAERVRAEKAIVAVETRLEDDARPKDIAMVLDVGKDNGVEEIFVFRMDTTDVGTRPGEGRQEIGSMDGNLGLRGPTLLVVLEIERRSERTVVLLPGDLFDIFQSFRDRVRIYRGRPRCS